MYNAPNHERSDATSVNMCDVHVFMRMHTCAHIWRSEMDAGVFPSYLLSQGFSEPGTLARLASQSSPRSPSFSVLSTARPHCLWRTCVFVLHCEHHEGGNGLSHSWRLSLGGPGFV